MNNPNPFLPTPAEQRTITKPEVHELINRLQLDYIPSKQSALNTMVKLTVQNTWDKLTNKGTTMPPEPEITPSDDAA